MSGFDLHVHSNFCDGKNCPEEMVESAIKKGLERIGVVAHSYVGFDESSCIPLEKIPEFLNETTRLKEKYRGKIEVLCGLEEDLFSEQSREGFDYTVGSVHYIKRGGEYISVDESPEMTLSALKRFYGGDFYSFAEDYFKNVSLLAQKAPDIIGHFDLVKKFEKSVPFDRANPRYISAWQSAAEALLPLGAPFELNTGGVCRGYSDEPYPSFEIAEYIKSRGGRLILSSDAHRAEDIAFGFERFEGRR